MSRGLLVAAASLAIAGAASSGQAATTSPIVFSADRAPSLSGEIYRVDPNGRVVDLSNSPYQDTNPSVSPDGKHVAFVSDRSGVKGVYEVGTDGKGLARLSPSAQLTYPFGDDGTQLVWQPRGGGLTVVASGGTWLVHPGRRSVHIGGGMQLAGWSPDGRLLAATTAPPHSGVYRLVTVTPDGHTRWMVRNVDVYGAAWSARGLLAVPTGGDLAGARHGVAVYDETGRLLFRARFGTDDVWPAWSPDGTRLGIASGKTLEVRTAAGRILLRRKLTHALGEGDLGWAGNERLILTRGTKLRIVDLRTGKMRPASKRYLGFTSPDGKLAVLTPPSRGRFALQVARTAGGRATTYTHVPGCSQNGGWGPDIGSLAFVPHSRSLVYASACIAAYPGLYSVPASGGTPRLITQAPREAHSSPALSPDGTEIAYSTQCDSHLCGGPGAIAVASMSGAERPLTTAGKCGGDYSPTWSPDGTTILFTRYACDGTPELYTVPASGAPTVHALGVSGTQPAWGPTRIAYVSSGIWTANPDGSDPLHLAGGNDFSPAWSPSGQLAYLTTTAAGTALVVGTTQTFLPFAHVTSLAWTPDGTRLVIAAAKTPVTPFDVYTIEPNGTDAVQLTENYDALSATG